METLPVPDNISCADQIFDISFHPSTPVVACGLISGHIEIHKYSIDSESELVLNLNHHSSSCRGLQFSEDGMALYSVSSDKSVRICNQLGQQISCYEQAHTQAINKMLCYSPNQLATGDDSGCVKIWDTRQRDHVMEFDLHEDFVSGITFVQEYNTLLTTGGDATLCAYDLRKPNDTARSDDQEAELHCVQCIKGGKKVVCGTQEGVIIVFSWGRWGDCSDRFPGHPTTVDCMLKVDESSLITGSGDGLIRVVALQPNKMLGVIGDHDQFPVEGIARTADGRVLGSFSHDEVLRFWDVSMLADDDDDSDACDGADDAGMSGDGDNGVHGVVDDADMMTEGVEESKGGEEEGEEEEEGQWEDVMGDEDDEDEDSEEDADSSDDEAEASEKPRFNLPTANQRFFSDL